MALGGITGGGYNPLFSAPTLRAPGGVDGLPAPVEPVQPVQRRGDQEFRPGAETDNRRPNTSPTEEERSRALASGRTRGSFLDISV